jgi:ketosteroid isomerase-like protein
VDGVFRRIPEDYDGFTIEVRRIVGLGDTVLVEGRYCGTVKGTGRRLDVQVAHVWDVHNGKVVRFQQYTDTLGVAQAAGVAPAI